MGLAAAALTGFGIGVASMLATLIPAVRGLNDFERHWINPLSRPRPRSRA